MKRHFTLIMTLLLVSTFISAEETYQEKVKNVYLKYACLYKYGPNVSYESLSSSEKAGLKNYASRDGVKSLEYKALDYFNSSQIKRYNMNMENEIQGLEKYKTASSANQKNSSATNGKKKNSKSDAEKQKEAEWIYYSTKTIKGVAEKYIAGKINEWSVKDVYEKTSEYEKRLRTESDSLFERICAEYLLELQNSVRISVKERKYDADKELLTISVSVWLSGYKELVFDNDVRVRLNPNDARNFNLRYLSDKTQSVIKRKIYIVEKEFINIPMVVDLDVVCSDGRIVNAGTDPILITITGANEFVISFDDERLNVTNPYLKNRKYNFTKNSIVYTPEELARFDTIAFRKVCKKVEMKCDSVNNDLLKYPFNYSGTRVECPKLDSSLIGAKGSALSSKIAEASRYMERRESYIKDSLLQDAKKDTVRYVNTVLEFDQDSKAQMEKQYVEYRCKYALQQFATLYFYNIIPDTITCREEYREKYLYLFKYPHEFDSSYQRGESAFLADIDSRIRQRSEVDSFIKWLNNFTMLNFKKDYDEDVVRIKKRYEELKDNLYLDDVKKALRNNEKLSAEWYKNGLWFASDYNAFITSYMSNHYKQDLKRLKK